MTTTNRVFKPNKTIKIPSQTVTADAMLDLADGTNRIPLDDVAWKRIVVELNVTAITGTNFVADIKTCIDPSFAFSDTEASNVQATQADGSTAFSSATITGTGRYMFSAAKEKSDGSACSNIGKAIGLFYDHNATSVTLEAWIYIEGE